MPVTYSCFISYSTGLGAELQEFIDLLQERLREVLKPFLREPPWRYDENERIGAAWQQVLPLRLCQSVCMVALYVPSYESSEQCVREFVAMEDIEQARLQVLDPQLDPDFRMIIPIILKKRKGEVVPDWIKNSKNYLDVTTFKTPDQRLVKVLDNQRCQDRLDEIAQTIYEVWRALTINHVDPCLNCGELLPPVEDQRVRNRWVSRAVFTLPSRQAPP